MQDKRNQAINTDLSEQGSFIKKLLDPQGYGLPVVIALALHIVIIALFAIEWPEEKRQIAEPTPKNIQAKVIQTESKQAKKRKLAEEKRLKNENWKKYLDKKKAAKQKARKDKAKRDKAAKVKLAKDKARKDKARKDKARKDKAKKEKLNADKAKQVALEKERAEKEQQAFDEQQEQELLEALAVEEQQRSMDQALADEQQTQRDAAITNDIVSQIQAKIYEAWRYPPSARPEMEVIVRISLVPTGEVIQVTLEKSSGNQALDRSVLAAVKRAQPLPVPKDSRLFEQQFRNFAMTFRPEDAVW